MEDPAVIRFDFGDGVSALDRTLRTLTMMAGQATARLTDAGYVRGDDFDLHIHPDGLPVWIDLGGKVAFEINAHVEKGVVNIKGSWKIRVRPKRQGILSWLLWWRRA